MLVEQYVELALRIAERAAVIEQGRITASGDTAHADQQALAGLVSV